MLHLLSSLATLGVGIYAFYQYSLHPECACFIYHTDWVKALNADFYIKMDGINSILVLLTVILVPFIVQSTSGREIKNPKAYFGLILAMQTALLGVFLAKDALLFYIFWELALIPIYLISLIWGGEGRQKITFKFFIYTLLVVYLCCLPSYICGCTIRQEISIFTIYTK
jgi:NADH-quinone oxidoreductase subunit M